MADMPVNDSDFRLAEGPESRIDFDEPAYPSSRSSDEWVTGWSHRLGGVAVDVLCAVLAVGLAVIFALTRFFGEGRQDAGEDADDSESVVSVQDSHNAMIVLGTMILAFLVILIWLVVIVQQRY